MSVFARPSDSAMRRKKLYALPKKSKKTLHRLVAVLKDDVSPVIRHEAAFLLGATKNKDAVPYLIYAIRHDKSDLVRHEATEALGDLGLKTKQVRRLLHDLLTKDKNPFIRDTADIALGSLGV